MTAPCVSLPPMSHAPRSLPDWLDGALGRALLDRERHVVREAFEPIFGAYLLQIGSWGARDTFLPLARTQRAALVAEPDAWGDIVSYATELAVASNSVDALFMPHTLELEPDPHAVLREAARVLVGDGHLVLLGFEPYGPWGVRHRASRAGFPPGLSSLWSDGRVADWLRLLGFEVAPARHYLGLWPSERLVGTAFGTALERTAERFARALPVRRTAGTCASPFAGAYLICARKRVYAMTRVLPVRRRRVALNAQLVPPAAGRSGALSLPAASRSAR